MEKSICHCEIYDVLHTDVFIHKQPILPKVVRQKGKSCKEVKSSSASFSKWIGTNNYFFLFKRDEKDKKPHVHELPQVGTCLVTLQGESSGRILFEFYSIPCPIVESLHPTLSLSVTQGDYLEVEKCLYLKLQVQHFPVNDFLYQQSNTPILECVLHITPSYICMTNKTDKNNLTFYCVVAITSETTILYDLENYSTDVLALKVKSSSHPDDMNELKFTTRFTDNILQLLKDYVKDKCSVKTDTKYECLVDDGRYEPIGPPAPPVPAPGRPTKIPSSVSSSLQQPPSINRGSKPATPVPDERKTFLEKKSNGIRIHYENTSGNVYNNVDIKTNGQPLKLSVSVFASEPILSEPWLLEIIFIRSEDFEGTFKSVQNSQELCGRHLIVPSRPIQAVTGMVVMLGIESTGFQVLSGEQHISYDKLAEITNVSWLVVEKVITYNGNTDDAVHFFSKLKLVSNLDSVNEEITVMDKFKGLKQVSYSSNLSDPFIFPLSYPARVQFCLLLDMKNVLGKDWKYFASLMGVDQIKIRVIEQDASSRQVSCTESVLCHLEAHNPVCCRYEYALQILNEMERGDLLELLISCNEKAVEDTEQVFFSYKKAPGENEF